jgi:hypothetical protein
LRSVYLLAVSRATIAVSRRISGPDRQTILSTILLTGTAREAGAKASVPGTQLKQRRRIGQALVRRLRDAGPALDLFAFILRLNTPCCEYQ